MKTLHRYLARQVIASLIMTVAVFTFVLLLGNALKEILPLLISGTVSIWIVTKAIALLIPYVLVFALPMGMLTATLLVFGRFSADQELTAVRASGMSLLSLVTPILLISLALCGLASYINMDLGPRCRAGYKELYFELRAEFSSAQLPEGRFIRDFPGFIFYAGKNRNGELHEVIVFILRDKTNVTETIRAPRGTFTFDSARELINISLYDGRLVTLGQDRPAGIMAFEEVPLELDMSARKKGPRVKLSELSFLQLQSEMEKVKSQMQSISIKEGVEVERQLAAIKAELAQQRENMETPIRFQMHRQVAFSFACFGFTLVGIPLGIRVHRRETNVGIAIALLLVAVYYGMVLVASGLDDQPGYAPHLLVWLPNFLFQAAGAVMLWKANRGM